MIAPEGDLYHDPAGDAENQYHPPPHSHHIHDDLGGAPLHLALQPPLFPSPGNEKEDGIVAKDQEKGNYSTDPAADVPEKPRKSLSRFYGVFLHIVLFLFFTG